MSHTLTMIPPLSSWPWGNFGVYKYVLYGPLVAKVIHSKPWEGEGKDLWCLHLLIICGLRGLVFTLWSSFSNMLFLIRRRRILQDGVGFKQIDAEWDWDNGLILHTLMGALTCYFFPNLKSTPLWNSWGLPLALAIHALISEPLFYLFHKIFHSDYFFKDYHSIHHSSPVPQPFTAGFATPLEHIVVGVVMGVPILGCFLIGVGSAGLVYVYVFMFDFLRCMGHSNVEVFPSGLFESFPFMRYLIYTPTYHSLHHTEKETNFCLFMPIFDVIGGTLNCKSWELQKEISSGKIEKVPDFVFLAHVVHIVHGTHSCFIFRSFASIPYRFQPFLVVLWPGIFLLTIMMLAFSKTFTVAFYNLRGKQHQTWLVPRCGIHYFLSFCLKGINEQIEMGIIRADKIGVKVISLGALNKNEALNGGGTLFVNKHPDLKIRVVHGNTLTAAVILKEIPKNVEEVFLTGATSKLGRAIALYLCRKKITVLMLTPSSERFQKIQKEAPAEYQPYLVQVTKYQAAQNCKTWIVGKWIKPKEQNCAPAGTHFQQFVVPPISSLRRDCTYGKLAAMRLPEDVEGLNMCEISLERGVVHACHAGGVVHFLEDYKHHEVGAIDVDRIDMVWEAAMKHGLKPV